MKEKSIRCGRIICEKYDSKSPSMCSIYVDRAQCSISNKQRRKNRNHSKRHNNDLAKRFL